MVDQLKTGTSDPRTNGADRTVENLAGFGIRQAKNLGEHERVTTVRIEPIKHVVEFRRAMVEVTLDHRGLVQPPITSPDSLATSSGVGTDSAGDLTNPMHCWTVTVVAMHRAHDARTRFLYEVIDRIAVAEMPTQWLNLGSGPSKESPNGSRITRTGSEEYLVPVFSGVRSHTPSQAGRSPQSSGASVTICALLRPTTR